MAEMTPEQALGQQDQLRQLLDQARENEAILKRIHDLVLALSVAQNLEEYVDVLFDQLHARFGLTQWSLELVKDHVSFEREGLRWVPEEASCWANEAYVGKAEDAPLMVPDGIASVALLPLRRGSHCFGHLNLYSENPDRYSTASGHYFLHYMATFIAVTLDNVLYIEQLRRVSVTDALTGLYNRRYFDERMQAELQRAQREQQPVSVIYADLDHFKRLNDDYGHAVGDQVLVAASDWMQSSLRSFDVMARYGGEEFVFFLPKTNNADAKIIAERIRHRVENEVLSTDQGDVGVTVSLGVSSELSQRSDDLLEVAQRLLRTADEALMQAKQNGRNRVVCSTGSTR